MSAFGAQRTSLVLTQSGHSDRSLPGPSPSSLWACPREVGCIYFIEMTRYSAREGMRVASVMLVCLNTLRYWVGEPDGGRGLHQLSAGMSGRGAGWPAGLQPRREYAPPRGA